MPNVMHNTQYNTQVFSFFAYLQTTGGPVCITTVENLDSWRGADSSGEDYEAVCLLPQSIAIKYKNHLIFNTETGNFLIFKNENEEWAIVEMHYWDSGFSMLWEGIAFSIGPKIMDAFFLSTHLIAFDSSLTIAPQDVKWTGVYSTSNTSIMDTFRFEAGARHIYQLSLKNDLVHLEGIYLKNKDYCSPV